MRVVFALALWVCTCGSTAWAADRLPIKIYFLAGQSNMVGPGRNAYLQEHHPELMKPRDDVYCAYAGKVTGPLMPGYGGREHGYGLEVTMGKVLGDAIDHPILLVKSCTGGTTLHKNWRPPSTVAQSGGEIGPLYSRMMRRFHNVLANLDLHVPGATERGVEIAGFVWFQGENDSLARDENGVGFWTHYERNLTHLIADVRSDLGVPELPVLIIQINDGTWDRKDRTTGEIVGGPDVRAAQQKVAEADPLAAWIKTCDLHQGYHYDNASHVTIGERAGAALLPLARKTVPQTAAEIAAGRQRFLARQPEPGHPDTLPLARGLIGYWKFDEGRGDSTVDSSSSSNSGVISGRPEWVDGLFGQALYLTGEQRIEMPAFKEPLGPDGHIENLSVSFWLRANRYGDGRVGRGTGEGYGKRNDHNWQYSEYANLTGWDVTTHDNDFCGFATASFKGGPKAVMSDRPIHLVGDGIEWHHVVMSYDGSAKSLNVYVDGTPTDPRRSKSSTQGIDQADHIIPAPKGTPLTLGGLIDRAGQFQVFDELAIWNRPLTLDDARTLYNSGHGVEIRLAAGD